MPRPRKEVERGLERKGFRRVEGDHHKFVYYSLAGDRTSINTKTSHSGKDISDNLLAQMARQCFLTNAQFRDLVDCTLDQSAYEAHLKQSTKL